jgi:nucleoside-diphosphate-sugar epimerase
MSLHVVFGSGQVGSTLAEQLVAAGHSVRTVSRSAREVPPGAEAVRADAADPQACANAARGAAVVYHCMNPAYSAAIWEQTLPVIQRNLIAAAGQNAARLVVLENLYAFGDLGHRPATERTPIQPRSRKGRIRARIDEEWRAAHERGEARIAVGHASDFFGPRGTQTLFEEHFWRRVLAGKSAQLLINPDTRHTYHYIPDVAAALATLGSASDDAYGTSWMLPCAPAVTTRTLIGYFGAALGRQIRVSVVPGIVRSALKLFVPIIAELDEMRYQWDEDFIVDGTRFRDHFGATATPLERAARNTVEWAMAYYGAGKPPSASRAQA